MNTTTSADILDTLDVPLNLLIHQDGDLVHEAEIQVDGDTTRMTFRFDDTGYALACDQIDIPTELAVQMARKILRAAGEPA